MSAVAACLPDGRLHLQHGPIDLIISVDPAEVREAAYAAARERFASVLDELVSELPLLRAPLLPGAPEPSGKIARRMDAAARTVSQYFITRMAAVAGSVADEALASMKAAAPMRRAYVNNGGDIAVFLAENETFTTAMINHDTGDLGRITLTHDDGIKGIATSGRHGRSHSLGIADSVTVLAASAAAADVAATLIANAVDLPGHPSVTRAPANALAPDSDLGAMPVVTGCAPLNAADKARALNAGLCRARALHRANLIKGAALFLQNETRLIGHAVPPKHLA